MRKDYFQKLDCLALAEHQVCYNWCCREKMMPSVKNISEGARHNRMVWAPYK